MKQRWSEQEGETSHHERTKTVKESGPLGNLFFSLKYEAKRYSFMRLTICLFLTTFFRIPLVSYLYVYIWGWVCTVAFTVSFLVMSEVEEYELNMN